MKIRSFSLMMSLTLTLLTVGIVTTTTQAAEAKHEIKAHIDEDCDIACQLFDEKKDCEEFFGKGGCEKHKQ